MKCLQDSDKYFILLFCQTDEGVFAIPEVIYDMDLYCHKIKVFDDFEQAENHMANIFSKLKSGETVCGHSYISYGIYKFGHREG